MRPAVIQHLLPNCAALPETTTNYGYWLWMFMTKKVVTAREADTVFDPVPSFQCRYVEHGSLETDGSNAA